MNYQEMLAKHGASSVHPGGFAATVDFLSHFPIRSKSRVLEVGCGTGRTACYLAKKGCQVTAIDLQPQMLEKAQKRADSEQVQIEFHAGDACNLPFESDQFEFVIVESVTVFVDVTRAFSEYNRVLQPNGKLYDREMLALIRHPRKVADAIYKLYGVKQVPDLSGWMTHLQAADFQATGIWKPTYVSHAMALNQEGMYPDPFPQIDSDALHDPQVRYLLERNLQVMTRYANYLGYGVLLGTKS